MNIKKGDIVVIRRGKDRGTSDKPKTGKVLHVFPSKNRLIIEGVNLMARHTRPSRRNPKGGIVRKEAPIHRAKVALFCKSCSAPTKVSYKILEETEGKKTKIRLCRKCGEAL
ncbi:MAG: 50S ribosomal protein L24 [candidate division Zixibacteria bacterium]|nr:50S ribosomal protein L24 [candidate division Zixibacteria bacterium]